jgi:hypothetical protein
MTLIENILISNVYASPGSGHAHGPEVSGTTQMIGIVIIGVISIAVFYFMSKKK